jgi:Mg2+ and Co2+ transporter CorA
MVKSLLPKQWDVPQIFRDRLGAQAGRQRTMVAEGHVLLILHQLPDPAEPDRREAYFFWRSPEGQWRSTAPGSGVRALHEHLDVFGKAIDELEDRVESAASADDYFTVLMRTAPLLRTSRNAHRAIQEAREAARDDKDVIAARDRAGDIERAAELIHGYARDGLDFRVAKTGEEQARLTGEAGTAAHRLNLIAAVFLPITAVGAVLGMNLAHGFETKDAPWPFWMVTLASFLLGFVVKGAVTRKA